MANEGVELHVFGISTAAVGLDEHHLVAVLRVDFSIQNVLDRGACTQRADGATT